jgi:hypothetical protein
MAEDNLFNRVKNAIRGQKSSFCSRSTSVTPLESLGLEQSIQYTDCDGKTTEIPYGQILDTGGYIPDCVQGGSPISVKEIPVKLFIQYGTTDCNTPPPPPPSSNIILLECNKQTPYVVTSSYTLTKGDICYITFKDNVLDNKCYEIGEVTNDPSVDTIEGEPQSFGPGKCLDCEQALWVTITDCDKGTQSIITLYGHPNTLIRGNVYQLSFYNESLPSGCYTIGDRTPNAVNNELTGSIEYIDCPTCLNPPA